MNIVLNFTASQSVNNLVADQPLAVMPAGLAKRLLQMYAAKLSVADPYDIIKEFKASINTNGTIQDAMVTAIEFVQERELIANIVAENWGAYEAPAETTHWDGDESDKIVN